jgi:5-hydroxyisourate hydrolase
MARLSTHVLDIAHGRPAAGLYVELYRIGPAGERIFITAASTNADGRTDQPLLSGETIAVGLYELVFTWPPTSKPRGCPCPTRPFWTRCPSASASPTKRGITTCHCSSHPTATAPTGVASMNPTRSVPLSASKSSLITTASSSSASGGGPKKRTTDKKSFQSLPSSKSTRLAKRLSERPRL